MDTIDQLVNEPDVRFISLSPPYNFLSPFNNEPFVLLLITGEAVTGDERLELCDQIVSSGCRYVCCFGHECELGHDTIDESYIATDPNYDPPEDTLIMTTWHDDEPLIDVMHFMIRCTSIDEDEPSHFLVVSIDGGVDQTDIIECIQNMDS